MKQYQAMLNSLESKNIPVHTSKYYEQAMGSWYIEIESNPTYRVVHDGRDRTIVLEVSINNEWKSLAADKTKSGKHLIEKLMNELTK